MADATPRILLVDDNANMRTLIAGLLSEQGFCVDEAADGLSALKRLAEDDFDLMITDVRLPPTLGGVETVRLARLRWPALRSLFISGASRPVCDDPEHDDFIAKPFNSRELLGCVWELLTRKVAQTRLQPARVAAAMALLDERISDLAHRRDPALSEELREVTAVRDWAEKLRSAAPE